jgi:hypothetical protein
VRKTRDDGANSASVNAGSARSTRTPPPIETPDRQNFVKQKSASVIAPRITTVSLPSHEDWADKKLLASPAPLPDPSLRRRLIEGTLLLTIAVPLLNLVTTDQVWEDFLITFRHTKNWVNGLGLTYNPGDRVHGFTSPRNLLLPALGYIGYYAGALRDDYPSLVSPRVTALQRQGVQGLFGVLFTLQSDWIVLRGREYKRLSESPEKWANCEVKAIFDALPRLSQYVDLLSGFGILLADRNSVILKRTEPVVP